MYKKKALDNGLRIVSCSMPARRSLALGIWIKVGGRYESEANKGISHFLEHLVFKGSSKFSCRKIKESIEGVGGSLNGFTTEELTCYLVKIPERYLDLATDILTDMALAPLLLTEEIEKERAVILEEIKMYKDLPQSYVYELLDELLWPDQPLGKSVIGTNESVRGIDKNKLLSFQENYYTPSNIVVSAAGSFKYGKFIKKLEDRFCGIKKKDTFTFLKAYQKQSRPAMNLFHKDTEQSHLALGFHSLKRDDPMKYALGLLHVILGANMSSRLFNEIREKRGLAYEIGTQVKRFDDTGAFIVHAGVDNRKVVDALSLTLKELTRIKKELVSADEFKRAKEFFQGQLMLALEDTLDHMLWIGESTVVSDKTHSLNEIIQGVRKVRREDIREVAQRIFRQECLNLALIGPLKESERQIHNQLNLE